MTSDVPIRYLSKDSLARRTLLPNDIIIETAGGAPGRPTGRTVLVTDRLYKASDLPLTCASFCRFLRINHSIAEPAYVFWYLQYLYAKGEMWTHQVQHTGVARFQYIRFANSIEIPLPPVPVQRAIAHFLGAIDEKIALNHLTSKTLEEMGNAIFKHWLIDLEFPNEEGKPYRSSGGEMRFSEELSREIPAGWEAKPIDEIANFLNGLALQNYPPENDTDFLPVIKIRELRHGVSRSSDRARPNIPNEYIVDNGDVLFSWSGSLEAAIWASGKGALNQHLFKVTSTAFPKWFYYYWILHHLPEYRRIAEGKATTMGHIQRHHLKSSLVLVPDDATLQRMDKMQAPIIDKLIQTGVESRGLSRIRDMLLLKLMSGKIRVPVGVG